MMRGIPLVNHRSVDQLDLEGAICGRRHQPITAAAVAVAKRKGPEPLHETVGSSHAQNVLRATLSEKTRSTYNPANRLSVREDDPDQEPPHFRNTAIEKDVATPGVAPIPKQPLLPAT